MWRPLVAIVVSLALPAGVSAGPLRDAAEKAGRDLAAQREAESRGRGRVWTGVGLLAGGTVLAVLGGLELREDDARNGGSEMDDPDDREDSDGWEKTMLGGGIAAAGVGALLLITGRKAGPVVSARAGRVMIRQTLRF